MAKSIRIDFADNITDKDYVQMANLLSEIAQMSEFHENTETLTDGLISTENLNAWRAEPWQDGEEEAVSEG